MIHDGCFSSAHVYPHKHEGLFLYTRMQHLKLFSGKVDIRPQSLCMQNILSEIYSTTDLLSLGLGKDLAVHDGCCGDASCHRVNLEQAAHAWWLDGVRHLTILTLVHILSHHLGEMEGG